MKQLRSADRCSLNSKCRRALSCMARPRHWTLADDRRLVCLKKSRTPTSVIAKAFRTSEESVRSRWCVLKKSMSQSGSDPDRQPANP
jgi:hypothetical protein